MALIFCDGFDTALTQNNIGIWDSVQVGADATLDYSTTYARTDSGANGKSLKMTGSATTKNTWIKKGLGSTYTDLYIGFAFLYDNDTYVLAASDDTGGHVPLLKLIASNGKPQIVVAINDQSLTLQTLRYDNSGPETFGNYTVLGSGSTALAVKTWYYIELHVIISDTVGETTVRINGTQDINVTGADTNNAGSDIATIQLFEEGRSDQGQAGEIYIDDVIVHDTTTAVSNSWPDNAGCVTLFPNADGTYTQWTSTAGAVDYTEVDDADSGDPDSTTTMLSDSTATQKTTVNLEPLSAAATIGGVQLCSYASNDVSGSSTVKDMTIVNASDYKNTAWTPSTSWEYHLTPLTVSPDTSIAWTKTEVDAMELGWETQ